jgi:hypothetical protein
MKQIYLASSYSFKYLVQLLNEEEYTVIEYKSKGVKEKFRLAKMYLERLDKEYEMVREDANRV